jgi:hypothetical protein
MHLRGTVNIGEDFFGTVASGWDKGSCKFKVLKKEHAALLHSKWKEQCLHPGVRNRLDEIKWNSVRMKRSKDGEEEPVSKVMETNQEEKENKQNAGRAAYAATTTENVFFCVLVIN